MKPQSQHDWEVGMCEEILEQVKGELYLDLRFLSIALSALETKENESIRLPACDGIHFFYNRIWLIDIYKKNPAFVDRVYLHSVLHCLFRHLWLQGNRDRYLWQLACDIVVEKTIDDIAEDKPGLKRALTFIRIKMYELMKEKSITSPAQVYNILLEYESDDLNRLQLEFYTDEHRFWPKDEQKTSQEIKVQQNWDKIAKQSTIQKKKSGKDAAESEKAILAAIKQGESRRKYKSFLQKFMVLNEEMMLDPDEFDLNYYTYGLSLYGNLPLIEPLETKEDKRLKNLVIVIDTSASTQGNLVQGFLNETAGILYNSENFFRNYHVTIIQCDDKIRKVDEIGNEEEFKKFLNIKMIFGGNGTDFRQPFEFISEEVKDGLRKKPDALLYFTDGKGKYPLSEPEFKTAFLFLEDYDVDTVPVWAYRLRVDEDSL